MQYADYLKSSEWKALRAAARERARNQCEHCGGSPDHVHHVRYPKNLKDDTLENLIVVCESCHMKHHGIRGESMTTAITMNFEGIILTVTDHNSEKWVRFKDIEKVLGLECSGWPTCKAVLKEHEHWELKQNPFSLQLDVFLSPEAVYFVGMRFGMSKKAESLRWALAEMATRKKSVQVQPGKMGSVIRQIGEAIEHLENEIESVKILHKQSEDRLREEYKRSEERIERRIDEQITSINQIVSDYMRTSDYIRRKNTKHSESLFGKFLALKAKSLGYFKAANGWVSRSGEHISYWMVSPDSQYGGINKWRVSFMDQSWEEFVEVHYKQGLFNA